MIQLTLQSGLRVLYHSKDILAVMEYEHKDAEDRPEVNSIVTVHIWTIGSATPIVQNVLVKEDIADIYCILHGVDPC